MGIVVMQKTDGMYVEEIEAQFIADAAEILDNYEPELAAELVSQLDRAFDKHDDLEDLIKMLELISYRAENLLYPQGYQIRWDVIEGYVIESED
jgi:DNA-binding GntR family transcriptional regulator